MPVDLICKYCGKPFRAKINKTTPRAYCSRSCGAHVSKNRGHGLSETAEYKIWGGMRHRCVNPKRPSFARYGGRGIKVCERWDLFENFLADMGPKPGPGYTIERVDNDGDYEPSNCKWATRAEQSKNRSNAYTSEQDQQIRDCAARGLNFRQMVSVIGKTRGSIAARAYYIGISSGQPVMKITDRPGYHSNTEAD